MPYNYRRKRSTFRRRPYTRKRTYRKRFSRFGRRKMNTNVYYFKRKSSFLYDWVSNAAFSEIDAAAAGQPTIKNIAFRLQDVPQFTDFTNVYDSYRIRGVKVNLIPVNNVSTWTQTTGMTGGQTGLFNAGQFAIRSFSAFDPNNDGVGIVGLTGVQQVQEYQNSKWTPYNRIHKRYVKPRITLTSPDGSNGINIVGKQPWVQCADNGQTIHYGMPFVIDPTAIPSGTVMYKVEATYYMQFARPK